jgi:hypothetical protein
MWNQFVLSGEHHSLCVLTENAKVVSQHNQALGGMCLGVAIDQGSEFHAMAWGSTEHLCMQKEELVHLGIVP